MITLYYLFTDKTYTKHTPDIYIIWTEDYLYVNYDMNIFKFLNH